MKGILYKQSPNFFTGFQKRFVILADKKLSYYAAEGEPAKGAINFDDYLCYVSIDTKMP